MNIPLSIYLHFPYCWSKCRYCAFNSIRYDKPQSLRFLAALKMEISRYGRSTRLHNRRISTLYMGGGTPSIFAAEQILDVLDHCRRNFDFEDDVEITMEANPGTVNPDKLTALKNGGITRLSLGIESLQDDELAMLGRAHNSRVAREAYATARMSGFENVNLDFIYALPDQPLDKWKRTLDEAIELGPEHISAYALSIEEGTAFEEDHRKGDLQLPDEGRQIRFDEMTQSRLSDAGYIRYEISNFARPGYACRHNLGYWDQREYLGLGPGAHSYYEGRRFSKLEDIDAYIRNVESGGRAIEESETIGPILAGSEAVIFGLRKTDGIQLDEIRSRFPLIESDRIRARLEEWSRDGLVDLNRSRVCPTPKGLRLLDRMAQDLLPVRETPSERSASGPAGVSRPRNASEITSRPREARP
jgi:putative oxygen-independent coproporphyrinogen III oxidase